MARQTSPRQIPLDLTTEPSFSRDAFLSADCNREALSRIEAWRDWPNRKLVLSGPAASGKSHLARIWADAADAVVVVARELANGDIPALARSNVAVEAADNVAGDAEAERALLHLHNLLQSCDRFLLLTARTEPGRWPVALPDLASRIASAGHARLLQPDDALLAAVLVKLFDDRQIRVSPQLVDYLARRIDRSLAAAQDAVAKLDAAALAAGRPVTREMAAAVLDIPSESPA